MNNISIKNKSDSFKCLENVRYAKWDYIHIDTKYDKIQMGTYLWSFFVSGEV